MSKNSPSDRREKMKAVTKSHPCPVCEGGHKCSVGDAGLILCGRREGPVNGFRHLGASQGDPQFHLYRRDDGKIPNRSSSKTPSNGRATDWEKVAKEHASRMTPEVRQWLAGQLKFPVEVLDALPLLGYNRAAQKGKKCITFPEYDATGKVIGINQRFIDGTKKAMKGSVRGLTLVTGWRERAGPVLLVEGASDTLALTAAGLAAVGRPSNTGGVMHLSALLCDVPTGRTILVVGENDTKESGRWPGREGAEQTAASLQAQLNRPVLLIMTPPGAKDVRQWLTERVAAGTAWEAAGRELLELFSTAAEPPPRRERPEIFVTTEEHAVNSAATEALAGAEGIYQRAGNWYASSG
jgi:putative DNA primase/helicase